MCNKMELMSTIPPYPTSLSPPQASRLVISNVWRKTETFFNVNKVIVDGFEHVQTEREIGGCKKLL